MAVLATLYLPDLNPVGTPSILAVVIAATAVSMAGGWPVATPRFMKLAVTVAAPWLFFVLLFLTEGSPLHGYRSFPDADDHVASVIYLALGLAFAIENFRLLRLPYRMNAALFTAAFGALLTLWLLHRRTWWYDDYWIAQVAFPVFWAAWLPVIVWLNRRTKLRLRHQRGRCIRCCYDLEGNVSGACPECGLEIANALRIVAAAHARSRRRLLKWVGVVAAALIALAWAASVPRAWYISRDIRDNRVLELTLAGGELACTYGEGRLVNGPSARGSAPRPGWCSTRPSVQRNKPRDCRQDDYWSVSYDLPLWIPWVAAVGLAGFAAWRNRRSFGPW